MSLSILRQIDDDVSHEVVGNAESSVQFLRKFGLCVEVHHNVITFGLLLDRISKLAHTPDICVEHFAALCDDRLNGFHHFVFLGVI